MRLYRAKKSHTLRLSSCMLWLCRVNKHGFCTTFPVSRSSFTNRLPKWRNCSISNLFWALRSIVRFRFARQPTKTKPISKNIVIRHVDLVCLRDKVAVCKVLQSGAATSSRYKKSRDKIARVWHRSYTPVSRMTVYRRNRGVRYPRCKSVNGYIDSSILIAGHSPVMSESLFTNTWRRRISPAESPPNPSICRALGGQLGVMSQQFRHSMLR